MKQLADRVFQLGGFPPNVMNVYLVGDVLVDAATRHAKRRIFRQVQGHGLSAHVITHVHPDHQGASKAVCERFGIPLWCGEADAPAMEDGRIAERQPDHWANGVSARLFAGPPYPVSRRLREGDEVAGFQVLDVPGHSAGHIALWRESDRLALVSDTFYTLDPTTGEFGQPRVAHDAFNLDTDQARASIRKVAALEPRTAWAGHADPVMGDVKGQLEQAAAT